MRVTKYCRACQTVVARRPFAPRKSNKLQDGRRRASLLRGKMLNRIAGELERYMDLLSARQKLVASNIANADTPGYRTRDIDFQSEFQNAMGTVPNVVEINGLAVRNDGNNVNLDREARLLAENALRFQMASNLLRSQIRLVRSAIDGGQST